MGDVSTHGIIEKKCREIANQFLPAEDTICIELGNWLTDFSQFRDPTSFMSGKFTAWDSKRHGMGLIPLALQLLADFDGFLDDLMGKPGQDGELSKWAKQFALAVTIQNFWQKEKMDADEVESLFNKYFTQYYPHEHLDFPPWPWGDLVGDRTASNVPAHSCLATSPSAAQRKMYQYTEDQLVYVSDRLTHIQKKWKEWDDNSSPGSDRQPLHELLCEFGHASHAVQDFYFHSNFIEQTWKKFRTDLPASDNPTRDQRRYNRRLKGPVAKGMVLDTSSSTSPDVTFTGYFGSTDMFHTFADAAKGLHKKAEPAFEIYKAFELLEAVEDDDSGDSAPPRNPDGSMMDHPDLSNDKWRADALAEYRKKYRDNTYTNLLDAGVTAGKIHLKAAAAVKQCLLIDDNLAKKYTGPKIKDMGIMGIVLELCNQVQTEHQKSDKAATDLDTNKVLDDSGAIKSDNGCSAENIGSHSLMAKDSVRKEPLRVQAVNVASLAAKYVAWTMFGNVYPAADQLAAARFNRDTTSDDRNTVDHPQSLDWLHLVQHFICHPAETETSPWNDKALDDENTPNFHIYHKIDQSEIDQRCKEEKRDALEKKYKDGEDYFQKMFAGRVLDDTVRDMLILAAAGAVVGAIIGGIVGGPAGAVAGALIGAVAGAVVVPILEAIAGAVAGLF